jgi:O-6-methylguanine DNA methyltransferase
MMETKFKNILAIIDRAAESSGIATTLFQDQANITYEDKQAFEEWSGKSFGYIKEIISIAYGKRQIAFNPFAGSNDSAAALLVFSRFDEESKPDIFYSLENTIYGQIIIASTHTGICYLVFFSGDEAKVPEILLKEFPGSAIIKERTAHQNAALAYLNGENSQTVHLHVKGTPANLQVWEALTNVPYGKLISYGTLAKATNHMAQDIGMAMGDNRIAMLIPCHRVIKATGELGQYHWGAKRKRAMIIKEAIVL